MQVGWAAQKSGGNTSCDSPEQIRNEFCDNVRLIRPRAFNSHSSKQRLDTNTVGPIRSIFYPHFRLNVLFTRFPGSYQVTGDEQVKINHWLFRQFSPVYREAKMYCYSTGENPSFRRL
jgi:hypothetical protein